MNIVDIIIIIFILLFGISGAKRGFFKEIVLCLGTILVFVLAFKFKDPLGNFFLLRFPMFDFPNLFKGVVVLNILVYQLLSFVLILSLLLIIFSIVLSVTGLFEKLLKITIVLGIPSKILGFIAGLVEGYVIAFVLLFFLTQPAFSFNSFMNSKFANKIVTSSPVLTNITQNTVDVIQDVYKLKDEKDTNIVNAKVFDIMLDKKIIDYNTAKSLYDEKRMVFDGMPEILDKYKEK